MNSVLDNLKRMFYLVKVTNKRDLLSVHNLQRIADLSKMPEDVITSISGLTMKGSYVWPPQTIAITCRHCSGVLNIREFDDKHWGLIKEKIARHAESHK